MVETDPGSGTVDEKPQNGARKPGPVLVVGATGDLGGKVVTALMTKGKPVRALVRPSSDAGALEASGVEIARGDGRDRASRRGTADQRGRGQGLPGQARDRGGAVRSAGLDRSSGLAFSPAAQRRVNRL